jgi:hypothetical protein
MDVSSAADTSRTVLSRVSNEFFNSFWVHNHPYLLGRPVGPSSLMVRSTVFELSAPFSDILHSHYSIALRRYQLVNFDGKTFLGCKSRITLRTSSWDQVSRFVIGHQLILLEAFDWVLHLLLLAARTISVTSWRKIKCLINAKFAG